MVAVTYTAPRIALPAYQRVEKRKGLFTRVLEALMESRLRQARREIEAYRHLLPHDLEAYGDRLTPRSEEQLPFGSL